MSDCGDSLHIYRREAGSTRVHHCQRTVSGTEKNTESVRLATTNPVDWTNLKHLGSAPTMELQDVLSRHTEVFKGELGLVRGMTAKIHVDPQAPP